MITDSNPYESPTQSNSKHRHTTGATLSRPRWLRFSWHAIAAVIVGCLIAGNPHEIESPLDLPWLIYLSMMMTWGPWVAPINTLYWIATPLVAIGLQFAKQARPNISRAVSFLQIAIWWSFWLLFGLAERFGRYDGP